MDVEVRDRTRPVRCSFCHAELVDERSVQECEGCGSAYHEGCGREHGSCPTLGCAHAARPVTRESEKDAAARASPWACVACGRPTVVGQIARCGVCGGAHHVECANELRCRSPGCGTVLHVPQRPTSTAFRERLPRLLLKVCACLVVAAAVATAQDGRRFRAFGGTKWTGADSGNGYRWRYYWNSPGPTVTNVEPGSKAEAVGLAPGDRIVAIDGTPAVDTDLDGNRLPPFEALQPLGKYQVDVASYDFAPGLHTEWEMTTPLRWKFRPTAARVLWLMSAVALLTAIGLRVRRSSSAT